MKKNEISTVIGIAVLLAMVLLTVTVQAQEKLVRQQLLNTAIGTGYALTGGSNVVVNTGLQIYQGGTSSVTLTNSQSVYAPATAVPFSLDFAQNVPVWWVLAGYSSASGASNTVVGLDLSSDGVYWTSNTVTATLAMTGTSTNVATGYFPLQSGTNAFSGYSMARWSFATTAQLGNVTLLQNRLQVVR